MQYVFLRTLHHLNRLVNVCCPRSVVSAGDLYCSVAGSAAHFTVTTAQGRVRLFLTLLT